MGALLAKLVFLEGTESVALSQEDASLWDYTITDIDGNTRSLREICRGKKAVLFVNVATKWGLSERDYLGMVACHRKFRQQGFEIVAFPCNQFKNQESGTNA